MRISSIKTTPEVSRQAADPMLSDMIATLRNSVSNPDGEFTRQDIALAIWHFASAYYDGRRSNLYQALSHLRYIYPFTPEPENTPEQEGGLVFGLYQELVKTYPQEVGHA